MTDVQPEAPQVQPAQETRLEQDAIPVLENLVALTTQLVQHARQQITPPERPIQRSHLKLGKFDGSTRVELFIQQFRDVAELNGWEGQERLLHLRNALTGDAADAVSAENEAELLLSLRTRFRKTRTAAKQTLKRLRYRSGDSVHSLGAKIWDLVTLIHPGQDQAQQYEVALDTLIDTIGHRGLGRHLQQQPPANWSTALHESHEYLNFMKPEGFNIKVAQLPEENEEEEYRLEEDPIKQLQEQVKALHIQVQPQPKQEASSEATPSSDTLLKDLIRAIREQTPSQDTTHPRPPLQCWHCSGPHRRSQCPTWRSAPRKERPVSNHYKKQSGNA